MAKQSGEQARREKVMSKVLRDFAKEKMGDDWTEFRELQAMAYFDISFGPYTAGDFSEEDPNRKTHWPGFEPACDRLKALLEAVPRTLYLDIDGEWCAEDEPHCAVCEGKGVVVSDETGEEIQCENCGGSGCDVGLELGTTYKLESSDIREILVGRDLAEYVR